MTHATVLASVGTAVLFTFYLVVFHMLSNLPIDSKPVYLGVHKRFWMQVGPPAPFAICMPPHAAQSEHCTNQTAAAPTGR